MTRPGCDSRMSAEMPCTRAVGVVSPAALSPWPRTSTAPRGIAAGGESFSILGAADIFFTPEPLLFLPLKPWRGACEVEPVLQQLRDDERVDAGGYIIQHNSGAPVEAFELAG